MDRTVVKIDVRDASGREDAVMLDAVLDEAMGENIILGQGFRYLQQLLRLERTPTGGKTIIDGRGIQYTASSLVTLLVGQSGRSWSTPAMFYISDNEDAASGGGYCILLGKSLKARFSLPRADGREVVGAAPTLIIYKDEQERKQRNEAAKNQPERRRKAKENEEALDKKKKERKHGENGQSASTT